MAKMSKRRKHIFLIGFSGSGKSTVGPLLAKRLRVTFIDTDDLIEQCFGKTIPEIFSQESEAAFRHAEAETVKELCLADYDFVAALGGGAFQDKNNRTQLQHNGIIIYLQCAVSEIYRRLQLTDSRPLLQVTPRKNESKRQAVLHRIKSLLRKRVTQYRTADIIISTTRRTPQEVVEIAAHKIRELYG